MFGVRMSLGEGGGHLLALESGSKLVKHRFKYEKIGDEFFTMFSFVVPHIIIIIIIKIRLHEVDGGAWTELPGSE